MRRLRARDPASYARVKQLLEAPMLVLALVFAVALLWPLAADVSADTRATLEGIQWFVWAAFVVEYLVLLWTAPDRLHMVRTHVLDLIIIVLPFLRPLRLLRLLTVFTRAGVATHRLTGRPGFRGFLLVALGVVVAAAGGVYAFEAGRPAANIDTFPEAMWWALVTSTTVGYGDYTPVTAEGRAIATVLMLVGVGVFGVVTANLAAFFVESADGHEEALADKVDALRVQVAELEARLVAVPAGDPGAHDVSGPGADPPAAPSGEGADAGPEGEG